MTSEPDLRAGRDALYTYVVVAVLVAVLVQINVTLAYVGHVGSALVSVLFLYAPMIVLGRRKEDLIDYGFRAEPIKRGLAICGVTMLVVFPLFVVGYFGFYEIACRSEVLAHLVPRGMCAQYGGLDALHWPDWSWSLETDQKYMLSAGFVLVQMLVVALPEELFFRGFLLGLLEKRFPPKRRFLGGGIGLALVLSSLAFAIIHIPKEGDPRNLATFFPGLVFGWMRSATGSIMASTITHGASNILVRALQLGSMR
ncbi:MAG TPA: CPBP family intramembrane glutamic endopeptidase [Kofleriaceae bacterium]